MNTLFSLTAEFTYLLYHTFSPILLQDHICYHWADEIINFCAAADSLPSELASKLRDHFKADHYDHLPLILERNLLGIS